MEKMKYSVNINGIDVDAIYSERNIKDIFLPFLRKLVSLQKEKGSRILVMLAAPPGAGKSTLLSFLEYLSKEEGLCEIETIGIDGFHHRQEYLLSHSTKIDNKEISLVEIKGSPITFDLEKLRMAIHRIAEGEDCTWPMYDRLLHNPFEDAIYVNGDIVLLEGNYLLLDEEGWRDLHQFADYTVKIIAEEAFLRDRLINRRIETGVSKEEAMRFVDYSDMANVRLCLQ
ncbi:MAG: nucleoside/nucleotide kinase family protein [Solobacterium sp.]|nr:nucleoside/nucleotide kinase family protein [Solobacterium sp.]